MITNRLLLSCLILFVIFCGLATRAWTRDTPDTQHYVCASGERFTIEPHRHHVRLRTGNGVFALTAAPAASGEKYSDGQNVFWNRNGKATLERPDTPSALDCRNESRS